MLVLVDAISVEAVTDPVKAISLSYTHLQSLLASSVHGLLDIPLPADSAVMFYHLQVHSHLVEWSQDLHQLKSIMDTLEEEDKLLDQAYVPISGTQKDSTANNGKDLRALTAHVTHHTESALSASTQAPQDGMELLEGIANLSKQMVGEAKEDVELFDRAGGSVGGYGN